LINIEEYGTVLWVTTKNRRKFAAKTTGASETSLNNIAQENCKINFNFYFFIALQVNISKLVLRWFALHLTTGRLIMYSCLPFDTPRLAARGSSFLQLVFHGFHRMFYRLPVYRTIDPDRFKITCKLVYKRYPFKNIER
jgi:hypothetical protein